VENKIIPYGMPAGLVNAAFVSNEFLPLQDGHWLTFTGTEAISFLPANPEYQNKDNLKIEITGFKILDTALPIDSFLQGNNSVRLSYKENFITIEFAALNFSNLLPTNYYYRLSGVDKDWVNGGTTRFANYTGLPPGRYTFDVRSTQGSHTGTITSFKLIITPPFWRTTWFKILCILIIAGLLYAVAKWRINMIRNEAKNKMHFTKQMAAMEMKALRSQMNPHFIFNCINSIDALIQNNDKYQATIYLNKFAKLIRNVLDSSNESSILFSEDMDTLQLYVDLEKLRSENKFSTQIDVSKELLNSDYKVPPLIVQSFVENAIHHGLRNREDSNGILQITVQRIEDTIQYTISDNGIGREAAGKLKKDEHQSYGMQMSIDRVKMFNEEENASVKIEDLYEKNLAAGTQVQVTLKIK
jgi:anti-sigma regulatory factor (Ser/Thr protein kinase)